MPVGGHFDSLTLYLRVRVTLKLMFSMDVDQR